MVAYKPCWNVYCHSIRVTSSLFDNFEMQMSKADVVKLDKH